MKATFFSQSLQLSGEEYFGTDNSNSGFEVHLPLLYPQYNQQTGVSDDVFRTAYAEHGNYRGQPNIRSQYDARSNPEHGYPVGMPPTPIYPGSSLDPDFSGEVFSLSLIWPNH